MRAGEGRFWISTKWLIGDVQGTPKVKKDVISWVIIPDKSHFFMVLYKYVLEVRGRSLKLQISLPEGVGRPVCPAPCGLCVPLCMSLCGCVCQGSRLQVRSPTTLLLL